MNDTSIPKLAKALERHYAKAADDAVPPPPRYSEAPREVGLTPMAWGLAALSLLGLLFGAGWIGSRLPEAREAVAGVAPPPIAAIVTEATPATVRCPEGRLGEQRLPAGCRVAFATPPMVLTTARRSRVVVSEGRVDVTDGWLVFDVEHREGGPLLVGFDGGVVEVLGTTFSVFQDAERGHVELVEGSVRIVASNQAAELLAPGERYGWTRGEAPTPGGTSTQGSQRPSPEPESIDEVARLRSKKDYGAARRLLRRLRTRAETTREREVLDYELGTVLEAAGASRGDRCAHWRRFQTRYPGSGYAVAVHKKLESCPSGGGAVGGEM